MGGQPGRRCNWPHLSAMEHTPSNTIGHGPQPRPSSYNAHLHVACPQVRDVVIGDEHHASGPDVDHVWSGAGRAGERGAELMTTPQTIEHGEKPHLFRLAHIIRWQQTAAPTFHRVLSHLWEELGQHALPRGHERAQLQLRLTPRALHMGCKEHGASGSGVHVP